MEDGGSSRLTLNVNHPPNSRLFLVISKSISEEAIREKFSLFGDIQDIWVVRDKQSKNHKGIAYVKFGKSWQACKAMEDMHGKTLTGDTKPIKVFIAQSRGSKSHRDVEDEELTRIFVMIPKSYAENDLREKFKDFGDIEYCNIVKNKKTGESKGFGYVRFLKPSQAAQAIENCDRSFKAILAEPKNKPTYSENNYVAGVKENLLSYGPGFHPLRGQNILPFHDFNNFETNEIRDEENITTCLSVSTRCMLTHEQIYSLFDVIPGLEYCEIQRDPNMGHAIVRYNNVASAVHAKEKLHGFEYPPGNQLRVNYIEDAHGDRRSNPIGMMALQLVAAQMMSITCTIPAGHQIDPSSSGCRGSTCIPISQLQLSCQWYHKFGSDFTPPRTNILTSIQESQQETKMLPGQKACTDLNLIKTVDDVNQQASKDDIKIEPLKLSNCPEDLDCDFCSDFLTLFIEIDNPALFQEGVQEGVSELVHTEDIVNQLNQKVLEYDNDPSSLCGSAEKLENETQVTKYTVTIPHSSNNSDLLESTSAPIRHQKW
ncbi:RNA-binding protein 45-like [Carcharodon carcharias]|uniref:RNA-binding protein 45-like n=1 Tax=Carcharodon carcharias TaxID=13397 RepID=UPI001B7DC0F7|nr:RNA-binding protein 45-like [Carcharodon carcharias]